MTWPASAAQCSTRNRRVTVAGLEPGKTYCFKPSYGTRYELLTIGEVSPKRTQAVASVDNGEPRRIYKGSYPGTFISLDADLRALAESPMRRLCPPPWPLAATCRRWSAATIPVCLSKSRIGLHKTTSRQPNESLMPLAHHGWQVTDRVTPATVDAQIEEAHAQIEYATGHPLPSRSP